MGMVGQKCADVTRGFCGWEKISKAVQEIVSVFIVFKYISALNFSNDDMVKHPGGIYSGKPEHRKLMSP